MEEKKYMIGEVYGRLTNCLNREVYYKMNALVNDSIIMMKPEELMAHLDSWIKGVNDRMPESRHLAIMRQVFAGNGHGSTMLIKDKAGNTVCRFDVHEVRRELSQEDVYKYLH